MDKLQKDCKSELQRDRAIPFWSWNDKLEPEELQRQIRSMKDAGFGGFFMHARGGLETEYLSEDWFKCVQACIEEAERVGMDAWAYDENGWPSGFVGGKLLSNPDFLAHYLTHKISDDFDDKAFAVFVLEGNRARRVTKAESGATYHLIYDNLSPSNTDILNPDVIDAFLAETHEQYYARFKKQAGKSLKGFFTDEPQYFRWGTPYSPRLADLYRERYDLDIRDGLLAVFLDVEGFETFRYRYYDGLRRLFEAFAKHVYDWCEEHRVKLTGHAVEESSFYGQMWCCGDIMPFYEYEHIPGIDWLGRGGSHELAAKQLGSMAMQMGKEQAISEMYACTGWDVTMKELKWIAEQQMVHGVNLICNHLLPYDIRGQRKRDYPCGFGEQTPWYEEQKGFNEYFARLGMLLSTSREEPDTVVIHPIQSCYITYKRDDDAASVREIESAFLTLIEKLGAMHIPHHYASESVMERHAHVEGNRLIVGKCSYGTVILPTTYTLTSHTAELLREFVSNGGKLLVDGKLPTLMDGAPHEYDFLSSTVDYAQLLEERPYATDDLGTTVRATLRDGKYGRFLYLVNVDKDNSARLKLTLHAKCAAIFDVETDEYLPASCTRSGEDLIVTLDFAPTQSYVLFLDKKVDEEYAEKDIISFQDLCPALKLKEIGRNYLTLDCARVSFDGKEYLEERYLPGIFDMLLKKRFNSELWLKYTFRADYLPEDLQLICEDMRILGVYLNGAELTLAPGQIIDRKFLTCKIADKIKSGENELVFHLNFYQRDYVYRCLFDPEITESLRNCLYYDTELEAVYLTGSFAVDFDQPYRLDESVAFENEGRPRITAPRSNPDCRNLAADGYPFYAGKATFTTNLVYNGGNYLLEGLGRFALANVRVNGKEIGKLRFSDSVELTPHLLEGDNVLELELFSGNRNLLGPHHNPVKEPLAVGPDTFTLCDYEDGISPLYQSRYAFVKFGVEKLLLKKY